MPANAQFESYGWEGLQMMPKSAGPPSTSLSRLMGLTSNY
jgi:hypothetical protein